MTRLAIYALGALIAAIALCYFTLQVAEGIAEQQNKRQKQIEETQP